MVICCFHINQQIISLRKHKTRRSVKAVPPLYVEVCCVSHYDLYFSRRLKGPYMYGWKMRPSSGCLCYSVGENHIYEVKEYDT